MKTAIVHDWLTGMRGGEKVLEALCDLYPEAPIYTLIHIPGSVSPKIESHPIRTSFLQRAPFVKSQYRNYLPFFPAAIENFDLQEFDFVISSSHCVAKGVIPSPAARHLCYCHTPMRYIWSHYWDYFGDHRVGWIKRRTVSFVASYLRVWDIATNSRVDEFVANSDYVAARVQRYYGRPSVVIYPPVDLDFFVPEDRTREGYYLIVSALVPYKRIELAVRAFAGGSRKLVIAGSGPELNRLRKEADSNVTFLGYVSNEKLRELYRTAKALIQPGVEDFGINVVEALACQCPVLAFREGGAVESITEQETGLFFNHLEAEEIRGAVDKMERLSFNNALMRESAMRFSPGRFQDELKSLIKQKFKFQ